MLNKLGEYLGKLKPQFDDDSVDRLNYIYTNIVILAFAITIAAKQYVGEPLQCWVPAQFKGGWEQYVENYCFVENTYWVPMDNRLPEDTNERDRLEIQYYQWVPFVLALQALLFYVPRLIWNMLNFQSGMNVTALIQSAFSTKKEGEKRVLKANHEDGLKVVVNHMKDAIDYHREWGKDHKKVPVISRLTKGLGVYLTVVYLLVKLLFIVNVVGQFLILNKFLGPNYRWWGFDILRDLITGQEWETSGHFPRVTMCDFEVRRLGNLQRFSVQCVLMINMFNEKLYLFLWWWFLFVAVLNCLNFLYWLFISLIPSVRVNFVRKYLAAKGKLDPTSPHGTKLRQFVNKVLRPDGVLVLRLISDNAGDVVTSKLVSGLWDKIYDVKVEKNPLDEEGFRETPPN
jgi:hypothetical protein